MPACTSTVAYASAAGTATNREGTGHGTGSFVEASVEKSPYKWSPEASCHE